MFALEKDGIGQLPDDPEKLKLLVVDLSRRLINAVHTIDAQKITIVKANMRVEATRKQFDDLNRRLHLEIVKNAALTRRRQHDEEAERYEKTKIFAEKLHEEFRLATIDHQISGSSREPLRISKLNAKINDVEVKQDSQKLLLRHLGKVEEIAEELCIAAQVGDIVLVNDLITKRGVDIHGMDSIGYLPLHYAISNGHVEVVKLLLENGADPSCYLSGHSSMEIAARFGQIDCIYELLRFGISIDDVGVTTKSAKKNISHAACTPILSAVKYNHVNCVRELIELGANIFAKDSGNNNILHICASGFRNLQPLNGGGVHSEIKLDQADSLQMLDLLFSYEGDTILQMLYEENVKHQTPLRIAIDNNNADITKYLNQFYENGTHISRSNHTNDDPNYYVHTKSNPTFGHEDIGINDDEAVACVSKKKYKLSGTGQREPLVKNGASDRGINKKLPSRTVAIGNASNCGKSRNTSGVIGHSKKTNYFRKILPQNIVMDSKGNITAAEPVTPIIPTTQSDSTLNRSLSQMKANRETLNDMPICVPPHAYYSQQPMPHPLDTDSVLSALTTNSLPMGSVKASSEYKRNNVKSGSNTSQMVESEYNALDIFEASQ